MISVKKLWERLGVLSKDSTSGYVSDDDFNSDLYSVQYKVQGVLIDNYENSQFASDALSRHIVAYSGTTQANGLVFVTNISTDLPLYAQGLSLMYMPSGNEQPSYKLGTNEIGMTVTSAIRKPNLAKNRTCYYYLGDNIQMLPKQALPIKLIYCKKPAEAKIVFVSESGDDNDYLVVDTVDTIDIDFPEDLFNMFVYFMLQARGIELKEDLLISYADLEINKENPKNK